jgi:hypothetical protein
VGILLARWEYYLARWEYYLARWGIVIDLVRDWHPSGCHISTTILEVRVIPICVHIYSFRARQHCLVLLCSPLPLRCQLTSDGQIKCRNGRSLGKILPFQSWVRDDTAIFI